MADLGIDVELKPVVNENEFTSKINALKELGKLPVTVNAGALRESINKAIAGSGINKLKLDINQPYLAKQIKAAISAANVGKLEINASSKSSAGKSSAKAASAEPSLKGSAKGSSRSTKKAAPKLIKNATDPLDKVSNYLVQAGDEVESGIKNSARVVRGIKKQLLYLESMKKPLDKKSIASVRANYDEIGNLEIGSNKWYNKVIEAQQRMNMAFSRNSVSQFEKMQNESKKISTMRSFIKRERSQYRDAGVPLPDNIRKLSSDIGKYRKMEGYAPKKQELGRSINSQWKAITNERSNFETQAKTANDRVNNLYKMKTSYGSYSDPDSIYAAARATEELNKTSKRAIEFKSRLFEATQKIAVAEKNNSKQALTSLQKYEDADYAARSRFSDMMVDIDKVRDQYYSAKLPLPKNVQKLHDDISSYNYGQGTRDEQTALRKSIDKQWTAFKKNQEKESNALPELFTRAEALRDAKTAKGHYPDEKSIKNALAAAETLRKTPEDSMRFLKMRLNAEKAVNDAEEKNSRIKVARLQEIENAYNNNKGANEYIKNRKDLMELENRVEKVRTGDVADKRSITSADELLDRLRNTSRSSFSYDQMLGEARDAVSEAEKKNSKAEIERIDKLKTKRGEMITQLNELESAKARNINRDSESIEYAHQELSALDKLSPASKEYKEQFDKASVAVQNALKANSTSSGLSDRAKEYAQAKKQASEYAKSLAYLRTQELTDKKSVTAAENALSEYMGMGLNANGRDAKLRQVGDLVSAAKAANTVKTLERQKSAQQDILAMQNVIDEVKGGTVLDSTSVANAQQLVTSLG